MQHADVDRAIGGTAELRQQAFRRVLVLEADPMHGDVERPTAQRHGLGPSLEDLYRLRQHQLVGDAGFGVVIAANDESLDSGLVQAAKLIRQKACGLHRGLLAVIEVAGDQKRVDLLRKAKLDHGGEGFPRRSADQVGERRLAQRQGAQRRIEVDVGCVDELEGHGESSGSPRFGEVTARRTRRWISLLAGTRAVGQRTPANAPGSRPARRGTPPCATAAELHSLPAASKTQRGCASAAPCTGSGATPCAYL